MNMSKFLNQLVAPLRSILPFAFLLLTLAAAATAQSSTATLSGTVEDQNAAGISAVSVTVENVGTRLKRTVTTNESGGFTLPLLPPGEYTVLLQRDGFASVEVRNVVLNVADQKALAIQLKVGDVNAAIEVRPDENLVNTSPAVATTIDRTFAANIPLNGRSFQSLIALTPGVVVVPALGPANAAGQFSVNGQRASANSFIVDGVSANSGASGFPGGADTTGNLPAFTALGTTQSLVSVDALQEFKMQTSGYAAEYGRQPGGQISIVTRSGENSFHGSVFDYLRNEAFDANDWFANRVGQPKPPMRQNDFGGTFSGPVFLPRFGDGGPGFYNGGDRTFFFFSYEGLRLRLPKFSLTNVPTLCLRGLGSCGLGQSAAPSSMQPILNAFPLPNGRDLGNGLAELNASYSDPSTLDATSIRIDHRLTKSLTLFARYNDSPSTSSSRNISTNLSNISSTEVKLRAVTLGATALLSPRVFNDVRVNYTHTGAIQETKQDNFGGATLMDRGVLIPSQYDGSGVQGTVNLAIPGRTAGGFASTFSFADGIGDQNQFNLVDNFSYNLHSHQFKFGFDYRRLTPKLATNTYVLATTFGTVTQIMQATAESGSVGTSLSREPEIVNFSAYAQDTWKPSRRLTLDLGVRLDINPAPTDRSGRDLPAVTQVENLASMDLAPLGTRIYKTTLHNFAPRIGVAYLLSQDSGRETVIRGGFGVFFDTGNDTVAQGFNQGYPFGAFGSLTNVSFPLSAVQVAPPLVPSQIGIAPPYPIMFISDPNLKLPYTLQWNLAVERSLGPNQTLSVSYVGAAGRRLLQRTRKNLAGINNRFTSIFLTNNNATSDYDALQASFQRRLSHGLQALASYTWSHALDDDSVSSGLAAPQHGNAAFDIRHIFSSAVTYDLPATKFSFFADALLRDWSIDTIFRAQSAPPLDMIVRTISDPLTGSFQSVRPNVIPGVPFYLTGSQYPGGRILNNAAPTAAQVTGAGCAPLTSTNAKGAFCTPLTGQSGNFGRNQLRGLPSWQVDLAIRRQFNLTEKLKLQLRAEGFNIFNHPNFGSVQTALAAANFGEATNMLNRQLGGLSQLYQIGGPRSMQFAVKLLF